MIAGEGVIVAGKLTFGPSAGLMSASSAIAAAGPTAGGGDELTSDIWGKVTIGIVYSGDSALSSVYQEGATCHIISSDHIRGSNQTWTWALLKRRADDRRLKGQC